MEEGPQLGAVSVDFQWDAAAGGVDGEYYSVYFGRAGQVRMLDLPEE